MIRAMLICGFIALTGCTPATVADVQTVTQESACESAGENPIQPCQVSIFRVLGEPGDFDQKYLQLVGYSVAIDGRRYLFATKDYADARDYPSSIAISSTSREMPNGLTRLIGKYSIASDAPPEGEAQGAKGKPSGTFTEVHSFSGAVLLPLPEKGAEAIKQGPDRGGSA